MNPTNQIQISSGNASLSESLPVGPYPAGNGTVFPNDVFLKLIKLFTPKELNSLSLVSKWWHNFISDRKIWVRFLKNHQYLTLNSIIFAETRLSSGFPLRKRHRSALSYMNIYNRKQNMKETLIIDVGTFLCKIGSSKNPGPSLYLDSFMMEMTDYQIPFRERIYTLLTEAYFRMSMLPFENPILISLPISFSSGSPIKNDMNNVLNQLSVPSICTIKQPSLALFASNKVSGIVVDIGFLETRVSPIFRGEVVANIGEGVIKVGGIDLTRFLKQQFVQMNLPLSSSLWTSLKENLCYVALDYNQEVHKNVEKAYDTGDRGTFILQQQRFQAGEILFNPQIVGIVDVALHHAVAGYIRRSYDFKPKGSDNTWYKTIILTGGTSLLPGLAERLKRELIAILPSSLSQGICVIPSSLGGDAVWHGGKLVSTVTTFQENWCKGDY